MKFLEKIQLFGAFVTATLLSLSCCHETAGSSAEKPSVQPSVTHPSDDGTMLYDIRMPGVHTTKEDEYVCTRWKVPAGENYIIQYEALADASFVHHILLFGCQTVGQKLFWTDCYGACSGETILYAWAQNAPPLELPKDVGFRIGTGTNINYIVMQIHYRRPMEANTPKDHSGIRVTVSPVRQKYVGGIYLMLRNELLIPAHAPLVHGDMSCQYNAKATVYPFAFRTHAHALGRVISGYHVSNNSWLLMAKGNPHWPQAFYPVKNKVIVKEGDYLVARCTYNASNKSVNTRIGSTHNDEMCNLYIMYYIANGAPSYFVCEGNNIPKLAAQLPADSDSALPANPVFDAIATGHLHKGIEAVQDWPQIQSSDNLVLGQVAGVATDTKGHVHIFHRGTHVWDDKSFDGSNMFLQVGNGPIQAETLIEFDPGNGRVLTQWGSHLFFLPHGLHIDSTDTFWITDVALHQVMKFKFKSPKPDLILGEKFKPGSDSKHFCKPTDVAVLSSGEFFVADGYCNSRVLKFSKDGQFLMQWGKESSKRNNEPPAVGTFALPHAVTVVERGQLVCVADRENGRIQCFDFNGNFVRQLNHKEFRPKMFSVTYSSHTGYLYALNGPDYVDPSRALLGSIVDPISNELVGTWQPKSVGFSRPHDVAVCPSGHNIYVAEIGPNRIWHFHDFANRTARTGSVKQSVTENIIHSATVTSNSRVHSRTGQIFRTMASMGPLTLVAAIIGLLILPLATIVLLVICARQCKRRAPGYRTLHSDSKQYSKNLKSSGDFRPLVSKSKVYKDIPDSDESETDEFNAAVINRQKGNTSL